MQQNPRVSTFEQKLESQIEVLKEAGAEEVFQEKFTGTTVERPQFNLVLKKLENGDTLIVTKLDRLARNTREVLEIVQSLFNRGIKVHILNIGLIDNTPTGQLIFTIFSAFAQFEREIILERQKEGIKIAAAQGKYKGRVHKLNPDQAQALRQAWDEKKYSSKVELAKAFGISRQAVYRYLQNGFLNAASDEIN